MKRFLFVMALLLAYTVSGMAQADRQYIRSGNKYYRQQNFVKAEAEYRKSLSVNPENPQALYNLGCALVMQKKDSVAVQQFEKAAKIETGRMRKAKIYHNIGFVCQSHKLYGDAINAYKESLRNNPADNETRYNLALCQRLNKSEQNRNKNNQNKNKNKDKQKKDKDKKQDQNKDKNNNKPRVLICDDAMREAAEKLTFTGEILSFEDIKEHSQDLEKLAENSMVYGRLQRFLAVPRRTY